MTRSPLLPRRVSNYRVTNKADKSLVYNQDLKRRRIENQKIGEFIVDAKQAVHFRLASTFPDEAHSEEYFAPLFMHFVSAI